MGESLSSMPEVNEFGWSIRPANNEDIEQIEKVRHKVWRSTYPKLAPEYISEEDVDSIFAESHQAAVLERGKKGIEHLAWHITVAETEEDVVGFCISSNVNEEMPEIRSLYVLDEHQGEGIGSALFKDALTWLEADQKPVKLEVLESNENAIKLYERFGFAIARKLPKEDPPPPLKYLPHLEMIRQPASIE